MFDYRCAIRDKCLRRSCCYWVLLVYATNYLVCIYIYIVEYPDTPVERLDPCHFVTHWGVMLSTAAVECCGNHWPPKSTAYQSGTQEVCRTWQHPRLACHDMQVVLSSATYYTHVRSESVLVRQWLVRGSLLPCLPYEWHDKIWAIRLTACDSGVQTRHKASYFFLWRLRTTQLDGLVINWSITLHTVLQCDLHA